LINHILWHLRHFLLRHALSRAREIARGSE
jgi:hypothetical protein